MVDIDAVASATNSHLLQTVFLTLWSFQSVKDCCSAYLCNANHMRVGHTSASYKFYISKSAPPRVLQEGILFYIRLILVLIRIALLRNRFAMLVSSIISNT